jgi:four helix bundle protein
MHDFRRLQVWPRARALFVEVDLLTKAFPRADRGIVANQLRRCALSISANIAEGCGKTSAKETIRFLQIAAGSVTEAESHILLATDLGYIHPKASDLLIAQIVAIRRMLFRLTQSLATRVPTSGG